MPLKEKLSQKFLELAGLIFVTLDKTGQVTYINQKGCEILGYKDWELLGQNWFERCIPKAHRDNIRKVFDRLMTGDVPPFEYYENPILTKSGEVRFIAWHNALLRDDSKEPVGCLSSGLDVTEQRQMVESLRDSESRLRAILETAVDGIITINDHGIMESVNSAVERIFGYSAEELLGKNVGILMPSPHREEHEDYIARYLSTGEKNIIGIGREVVGLRKDGTTVPLHLSVSEFSVGDQVMFTGILRDITEQKTLQEQILQSERLAVIGKMAAKVAHEIRNPLSSISLNAELLEDEIRSLECENTEEISSLITSMICEIDRVTSLTDEYLQFSRLPESKLIKGSFNDVIVEIAEFLESELKQKKIRFEHEDSKPEFEVYMDRTQFRRVLLNIIRNAIEAMPDGGKLKIWTEKTEQHGIVNIRDSGHGIPDENVDSIFDPFFTTKDFGTGLGLAIAQQVVHEHGGQIRCSSEVGRGTTFRIELPLETNNNEEIQ
ncbi:PAS domain S-box protein [candidate division KSB1 bacterium]|nr:PAS domain S-box protein [candidate division KSB1 bacterium]NIS24128.1 PAS domain S-box protein [candidate division KSB1 bacterium]NIT71042.1 PAS domain S-box protein [candidate division KSB1 bacterium]NIU24747.1 PAS domain S-box protein [candidate division KSB1 bacterium]NIU90322.1 PAS domain S-box protein [candidate division KSB1 bacterium]